MRIRVKSNVAAVAMAWLGVAGALAGGPVLNGIDVLARDGFKPLHGMRVGLITNASGHDRARNPTVDLLHAAENVELVALFGPEHGIRADLDQEKIPDGKDAATGLVIHSLYGERRSPTPEQLAGLDALVFDVQDVGCRFYTYLSTLVLAMEAAAPAGVRGQRRSPARPGAGSSGTRVSWDHADTEAGEPRRAAKRWQGCWYS